MSKKYLFNSFNVVCQALPWTPEMLCFCRGEALGLLPSGSVPSMLYLVGSLSCSRRAVPCSHLLTGRRAKPIVSPSPLFIPSFLHLYLSSFKVPLTFKPRCIMCPDFSCALSSLGIYLPSTVFLERNFPSLKIQFKSRLLHKALSLYFQFFYLSVRIIHPYSSFELHFSFV